MALLDPSLLARLERLQLATRRPLAGHLAGEHRSKRHGTSLDFADYREYTPGDDFRRIDYNLLARLDVLLIKLFEADDELDVRLLVDTSASMGTDDKLLQAQRVAAALGFVALVRRDVVTLSRFPHHGRAPRYLGRQSAPRLFEDLEALTASGETAMSAAMVRHLARPGASGLTVLVSDLLTPEWEQAITRPTARGGDLVVVHVLAKNDIEPTLYGDIDVIDREDTSRVAVSLSADTIARYTTAATEWLDAVAARCRQVGAGYVRVDSDDDIERLLLANWRQEGVLK
ncbi:MAG: DUF58 domain-containing protein [Ilumatobacter sp.]|uniref:DUF58 domain-containing protein n=1 Tax=Ilumatobacter sp. TaxID=1967498 RepID=UPI003C7442B1